MFAVFFSILVIVGGLYLIGNEQKPIESGYAKVKGVFTDTLSYVDWPFARKVALVFGGPIFVLLLPLLLTI